MKPTQIPRTYSVTMIVLLSLLVSVTTAIPAKGALILTAAGMADGFTLTTFATLNPGATGVGPLGITLLPNGNVIVNNIFGSDLRYVFPDVDGQTPTTALFSTPAGGFNNPAFANSNGQAYGANGQAGQYVEFNTNGTINHVLTGVPNSFLGMWTDPLNQHLIAASSSGLIDIDPLANGGSGSFRVIAAGVLADGVSVSPDGTTVYAEVGGTIQAYNITTGALLHTYTGFNAPDGNGVITSTNNLNGKIIVNTNFGDVDLLDPVTGNIVVIATGGTRGDYVSADTSNGTLFMDYSDVVERLGCGQGCSIGGPPPVPEPSTITLLGFSLAGLVVMRRLRAR